MEKYTKKAVTIEAIQFFEKRYHEQQELYAMVSDRAMLTEVWFPKTAADGRYVIRTLEGDMTVSEGDWIIKGVAGEFYPCKPDIFEATYTWANDQLGIHEWFGLTYAQYLTVPRTVLQSMPLDWQHRFVEMLQQLDETNWRSLVDEEGDYKVELRKVDPFEEDGWGPVLQDDLADYQRGRRNIFLSN